MHAVHKDTEYRRHDVSELNVMDFVETEYKSDDSEYEVTQDDTRRKSQRPSVVPARYEYEMMEDELEKSSLSPNCYKKFMKNRRKKESSRAAAVYDSSGCSTSIERDEESCLYPYATILQCLCEEVGKISPAEERGETEKLFKTLDYSNLCYPYATLLQEMHVTAKEEQGSLSTIEEDNSSNSPEAGIPQVMKDFNCKTSSLFGNEADQEYEEEDECETPFCESLLDIIESHNLDDRSDVVNDKAISGVGKILRNCISKTPDNRPAKELATSALLQKISSLVERENNMNDVRNQALSESSTESMPEEEGEWRPSNWPGKNSPYLEDEQRKRKSLRKKKSITKYDATPVKSKNKLIRKSDNKSPSLLQLILGQGSNARSVREPIIRKTKDPKSRSQVLEKIKDKINSRRSVSSIDVSNPFFNEMQKIAEYFRSEACQPEGGDENPKTDHRAEQQRSLLKEYLLKPTDGETSSKENFDIPKLSDNSFLFSRLLQNFKTAADSQQTYSGLGELEQHSGSSILRQMLIDTCRPFPNRNESGDDTQDFKPLELLNLSSLHTLLSERSNADTENEFIAVKQEVEDELDSRTSSSLLKEDNNTVFCSIKQEVEDVDDYMTSDNVLGENFTHSESYSVSGEETEETVGVDSSEHTRLSSLENYPSEVDFTSSVNPVCSLKCELKYEDDYCDDSHECSVCHLQFSSGIDLANHEMLFHCSDETNATGPACVLPHTSEIIQKSLFQEKLPA